MSLKYLFIAHFKSGDILKQTPDDISTIDPTKSSFFDVLEKEKTDELIAFGLHSTDTPVVAVVDLVHGIFNLSGIWFSAHDPRVAVDANAKLRLIYFRQMAQHRSSDGTERTECLNFQIGFQWLDHDGNNHQRTIAIA